MKLSHTSPWWPLRGIRHGPRCLGPRCIIRRGKVSWERKQVPRAAGADGTGDQGFGARSDHHRQASKKLRFSKGTKCDDRSTELNGSITVSVSSVSLAEPGARTRILSIILIMTV